MSGSGSGGSPSFNRPDSGDDCRKLVITTHLASPNPPVIRLLSAGDTLSIVTASDQGPIRALDDRGEIAGTILSREQIRLLKCMNSGVEFEAVVLSVVGAQCKIQISAR